MTAQALALKAVGGTREQLILAAERLFAVRGIDGVSLREINAAAGQRNLSAAHYHFGSKDALVTAIYDYRMERVNQRRMAMLDELEARHALRDVRSLVEAIILPIVEEIEGSAGGSHYIRFLAQAIGHPQLKLADLWTSRHADGLVRIVAALRKALPHIPAVISGQRFGLMWEQVIHALADAERLRRTDGGASTSLFALNLIDVVTGGLTAPVAPATLRAVRRRGAATARPVNPRRTRERAV